MGGRGSRGSDLRAGLTGLERLRCRGADAEGTPAVESNDGAAQREKQDGADDEGSGGSQARQVCAARSHTSVIGV